MSLTFSIVDLDLHLEQAIECRRDAWLASKGDLNGFSIAETRAWFTTLMRGYPQGFLHVWQDTDLVGQLEIRVVLNAEPQNFRGYVNLFYVHPEWRNRGVGGQLHNYAINHFSSQRCTFAQLRVSPGNIIAKAFYAKHGWQAEGELDHRGQLMRFNLSA